MSRGYAEHLLQCGFKLFPLRAGERKDWKEPAVSGWQSYAIDSPHGDHYGWAIPEGYAAFDLDVDITTLPQEWQDALNAVDAVGTSASGRGKHYLFEYSGENLPRDVKIDGKTIGQWCIGGKHYLKVCGFKASQSNEFKKLDCGPIPATLGLQYDNGDRAGTLCLSVPEDFTTIPDEGSRNNWLNALGGKLGRQGVDGETIASLMGVLGPALGQSDRWVKTWVETSLPRYLRQRGPVISDTAQDVVMSAAEIEAGDFPAPSFWHNFYGEGQAVILYGYTGHGKSLLMLNHVYDLVDKGLRCIIADGELSLSLIKHRIGKGNTEYPHFMKPQAMSEWYDYDYSPYDVIILDTKTALYEDQEPNENKAEHWSRLHKFVLFWRDEGKCVVLVHHSGKNDDMRGSSNAATPFDTTVRIWKDDETYYWQIKKDRHNLNMPKIEFSIDEGIKPGVTVEERYIEK